MNDFGVNDIFQNIHASDALEGYIGFAIEQIDNSFFRDMYMDTMEAVLSGNDTVSTDQYLRSAANENVNDMSDLELGLPPVNETAECGIYECGDNCTKECGGRSCENRVDKDYLYGKDANEKDNAYIRSLNTILGSDVTDAGTYFNLKDQKPSVESTSALQEVRDLISIIPQTDIIV